MTFLPIRRNEEVGQSAEMKRSFLLLLICVFLTTFIFDRLSKSILLESVLHWSSVGPFFFEAHLNQGFILQTLSQSSVMARVVFVSSLYGFLFFGFFLVQSILSGSLSSLRMGLTLFFSSISGNGYDRAFSGAVTDFICYRFKERTFYFNLADIFMWIGVSLILYSIFRYDQEIWHPNSKRKRYLIDQAYQYKWAFQISLIALSGTLIFILFSYSFMTYGSMHLQNTDGLAYLLSAGALGVKRRRGEFYPSKDR